MLAVLNGRAQPKVQQIDLRWRQQACQDLMRRGACDRLPVRWSGRTRRARRQPTTCTIRSTMPGGERQHGMRGIKDLIKLDGPALRQVVGHGAPVGTDEPRRHDLLPRHAFRPPVRQQRC